MAENTPIIALDYGHGGSDSGAVYKGRKEKDDNMRLGSAVGKKLSADYVVDVKYTRTTDIFERPIKKAQDANDFGADLFVSFHRNLFNQKAKGFEALVYKLSGPAYNLAKVLCKDMEDVGFSNRGVKKRNDLTVLKATTMPAVLLETGFIDNAADNKIFDDKFDQIVAIIVKRIAEVMKLKKKATPKPVEVASIFKNGDYNNKVETTANLNVRSGRGTEFDILGTLPKGTVVKVLYILKAKDGYFWGSIDYGKNVGFIRLDYVKPV